LVNWYEHHIGDYDKNTSHLTACEDGIYSRLIRRYYDKEKPLPADVGEVKRLARARARDEREAVDSVLREFFHLEADGWHHDKCDEVIAAFQACEPEREAKKKNEDTRLSRHRAERAELFSVINANGAHRPYNTPIGELRGLVAELQKAPPATNPATGTAAPATQPATAPATLATATQPPLPTTHYPELNTPLTPQGGRRPRKPRVGEPDYTPGFLSFWAVWPRSHRKEAKGACFEKWGLAGCEPLADVIVAHVEHQAASAKWQENDGEFVPKPMTYLNQRRWEGAELLPIEQRSGHSEVAL
jgi:uncharacterized protein YdaU (DUF1376 family)